MQKEKTAILSFCASGLPLFTASTQNKVLENSGVFQRRFTMTMTLPNRLFRMSCFVAKATIVDCTVNLETQESWDDPFEQESDSQSLTESVANSEDFASEKESSNNNEESGSDTQ